MKPHRDKIMQGMNRRSGQEERGKPVLLCDPGSELRRLLRTGGGEKRRVTKMSRERKKKLF